jgi:enamine deaminase RidA (YjgF/YER057c/UK114 family)
VTTADQRTEEPLGDTTARPPDDDQGGTSGHPGRCRGSREEHVRKHHVTPEGLAPANGYSHAVVASGRVVAVAGQVALDEAGHLVGAGDPRAQTERVFENLRLALAAAGATFADVVKLTYFCTDITMLPVVRDVRRWPSFRRPGRTCDRNPLPGSPGSG